MKHVAYYLTELVVDLLRELGFELSGEIGKDIELVQMTKNAKFGDFQSNHAFRLAKENRQNPRDLAAQVVQKFQESDLHSCFEKVEVAGPGFINMTLANSWIATQIQHMYRDPNCGIVQVPDKTVVIDYSSPNVAKRMHIGHMRSTIIGNCLDRVYRAKGYRVIADNHIGDWGTQFGKLIVQWNEQVDLVHFEQDPIGELERLYVSFAQIDEDQKEEKEAQARAETAKLQSGDESNLNLWKRFIEASMVEFNGVYQRLGISFDEVLGESAYNEQLPSVVSELQKFEIATDSEGAVVVQFLEDHSIKRLRGSTLVIQKQDGAFLYGTTDLATLEYREKTWSPDEIVYVTDTRQQLHFLQVFETWNQWRKLRGESDLKKPILSHTWFGMLKLPEGAMSTRMGNVIRLIDLLDEAQHRARSVVEEKSPEYSDDDKDRIAEAVGVSSVRYADLSQNPQSDVTFSWDKMLSLDGNTAPALMYGYARGRGIQRKAGVLQPHVNDLHICDESERDVLVHILKFPIVVEMVVETKKTNLLCDYLFECANKFNRFYNQNSVLHAENEAIKKSRLSLVEAFLYIQKKGMEILGVVPLDRM